LSRPDFRATAARRLSEDRELSPAIVSLLTSESTGRTTGVRHVPIERIEPNPDQPRMTFDETTLDDLAASIREHGVLQPVLVRPLGGGRYQLIAGERRWRASQIAKLEEIPALIEDIDDDTALEIAIIENLQREDLSPLDEAMMYDRMVKEHGYSIRKLAQKIGKDKGYLENRLRLADAPPEVQELVSLRKDTLSHAYELMKIDDQRKRRRLAGQVARGELSLVKLRERVEGRRPRQILEEADLEQSETGMPAVPAAVEGDAEATAAWTGVRRPVPISDDSLVNAKHKLGEALEELVDVLSAEGVTDEIDVIDRDNLAKYLTIAKLRLENAIALVRSGRPREEM
jgi:ParB family chromosome partitioning protein